MFEDLSCLLKPEMLEVTFESRDAEKQQIRSLEDGVNRLAEFDNSEKYLAIRAAATSIYSDLQLFAVDGKPTMLLILQAPTCNYSEFFTGVRHSNLVIYL